jgi:signal transduction histidine kinase/ActR/RegA family two-component response regulator
MINRNYLFYLWVLRKLPLELRSSQDFYFLINSAAAIIFLLPISALMMTLSNPVAAWSCLSAACVLAVNLGFWRFGLKMLWSHALYQMTLISLILFNAAMTDGLMSAYMMFMGLVPLLAVFCMNRQWAIFWVVVSFFSMLVMFWAQLSGVLPMRESAAWQDLAVSFLCIMVLEITQVILVFVYDSANARSLHAMNRANRRLASISQALQKADSHKDKFLAMVSHDMRTPLNAVIGYLGLVQDAKQLPNESMGFISSAQHAAAHLLSVINDLLDFSQIRLGQLTLNPQTVNLTHVLKQTFHTLDHQAQEMQLDYRLTLADDLPQWVSMDQNRLSQILINLLGNAIKFTPKGHVHMQAHTVQTKEGLRLLVSVEDTGIGMSAEQQERIYLPFIQVHDAQTAMRLSEPMRGNGLGLAITLSLVKSHHGQLKLVSSPGQGSTFTIELPLTLADAPLQSPAPFNASIQQDLSAIKLLVVDDNNVNRLLVTTTLLRSFPNAHIEQAESGQQALSLMQSQVYDLVLIDLIMPDLDGTEVVQHIRQHAAKPFSEVPVVALTANVAQDAMQRCRQVGINHVLAKPFDRNMLLRTVRFYTVEHQQGEL